MKKIVCLLTALVLCLGLAAPVFAADSGFVPSITYKPTPDIVFVTDENGKEAIGVVRNENGEVIDYVGHDCLLITPVAHIWDSGVNVPEEIKELLTTVYEGRRDGTVSIPYEKLGDNVSATNKVIRDLLDARWVCDEHREMIEKDGVTFEITFDLGVVANAEIYAMTFDETTKEWSPIVKTVNNGDGTVTCTFEHLCVVAFVMPQAGNAAPTDDAQSVNLLPWIIVMAVAVVGVVVVVVIKNKKAA